MAYQDDILSGSPVAYWRVGESSGVTSDDISGNLHDITWSVTPTQGQAGAISGDADTSVAFSGTQYGAFPNDADFNPAAVSVGVWTKRSSLPGASVAEFILDRFGSADGYGLSWYGPNIRFAVNGGLGTATGSYPDDNEWHYVVCTYSTGAGLIVYLDGGVIATDNYTSALTYSGVRNQIGRIATSSYLDNATIDELTIYDRVLPISEIGGYYSLGIGTVGLIISDIQHAHTTDPLSLIANQLQISGLEHAHLVDQLSLGTQETLTVSPLLHDHVVDSLLLGTQETLIIPDTLHAHLVDNIGLATKETLVIADVDHDHLTDLITLEFVPYTEPHAGQVVRYTCTITAPTFTDLVVPISSFQMTLRQSTNQCYLSVVIPEILSYADDISAMAAGTVTVAEVRDGISKNLLTANISTIRTDQGARNRSGTIVSYKQITFPGTGSHTLTGASYRASNNGTRRYRATPNFLVKPTDSVTINSETFDVETVNWTVSNAFKTMEISELLP